jgi:serine/threonine-protein kinase
VTLELGSVIQGKYRITRLIGRGGMGAVYEGENTLIARRVAIKVLHGELTVHPEAVERFEREAQAAGRIGNDHILEVLDLGDLPNGERFMVMEFLDGESLEDRLERCTMLNARQTVPLVRQLLLGLGAAHEKGIIHRDLKPENVFILKEKAGHQDFVKIIDFGISKFTASTDLRMTATGAVMGTPYYMSPEQAKGSKEIDTRSDLYAVGVILYRCVTGHVPFSGENFNEVLFNVVLSQATNPRELAPALEPGFENIIAHAMARDPAHRFQSAAEFISVLDAWLTDGAVVSLPPPQRTSVGAVSQPGQSQTLSSASDVGLGPPSSSDQPLPGGITSAEWTQSGVSVPRRSQGTLLRVAALMLLGGGALAAGYVSFGGDSPNSAATATSLASAVADPTAQESDGEALPLAAVSAPSAIPTSSAEPPEVVTANASATVQPALDSRPSSVRPRKHHSSSAVLAPSLPEPPPVRTREPAAAAPPPPPPAAPPSPPPGPRPAKKKAQRPPSDDVDFGY